MPYNTRGRRRTTQPPGPEELSTDHGRVQSTGKSQERRDSRKKRAAASTPAQNSHRKTVRVRTPDELEEAASSAQLRAEILALRQQIEEATRRQQTAEQAAQAEAAAKAHEEKARKKEELKARRRAKDHQLPK